jgi:hypothetical protein
MTKWQVTIRIFCFIAAKFATAVASVAIVGAIAKYVL